MELTVVNERTIKYVATFHGLNGYGNSIQTYPPKDGFADANAISLAAVYGNSIACDLPEGTVNVVVNKEETEMLDSFFLHNHAFNNVLSDLQLYTTRRHNDSSVSADYDELFHKLYGVSHGDVLKFNYAVADMFDEIVYKATGNHLEDYIAEKEVKEIANFTVVTKPKEGDNL